MKWTPVSNRKGAKWSCSIALTEIERPKIRKNGKHNTHMQPIQSEQHCNSVREEKH